MPWTDVAYAVGALTLGTLFGTATGLLPGLHVNTVSPLVLAGTAALLGAAVGDGLGPGGAAMLLILTVAVVHTVVNIIPTLAAPIPEDGTELILLPAQQMAKTGRALDALRLSVRGSWTGGLLAAFVALGILFVIPHGLPKVPPKSAAAIVALIIALLLAKQGRPWHATATLFLAGVSGLLLLPVTLVGPFGGDGTILLPAFAGLYGAPMLLMTLFEKEATGEAASASTGESGPNGPFAPLLGGLCGILVALFPGLTSATAGTLGRVLRKPRSDEEAVTMLSAVDTANVVGNTAALVVWGAIRSGASSAASTAQPRVSDAGASIIAAWTIGTVLAALGLAAFVSLRFGPALVTRLRRVPVRKLATAALLLLALIVIVQSGPLGLVVTAALVPLGMLPHRWGVSRSLLMGFLLVPYLGAALV